MDNAQTTTRYQQAHDRMMTQAVISIDDAALIFDVDRKSAFKAAGSGQIPTVQIGCIRKVPTAKLRDMLGLSAQAAA